MGSIKHQQPVKLICGIFWTETIGVSQILDVLQKTWGPIDSFGPIFPFNHTKYYDDEMGSDLEKQYVSFENLVDIDTMPDIKILSNSLEKPFFADGKRHVNIDPGYIADAKLVMPTTKNLSHRVYIGKNIFADLQLMYKKESFHFTPWTFNDVREPLNIAFFNTVRATYMEQLKLLRRTTLSKSD